MKSKKIDPRVKLLSLFLISFIAMTGTTVGNQIYPRLLIIIIPAFCLVYLGFNKLGSLCLILLFAGWYGESFPFGNQYSATNSLIFITTNLITRFLPPALMGYILIKTTSVEEFIRALEKLRVPNTLTIPIAVMFRFLPVVFQESRNIKYAMRMRGVTLGQSLVHPIRYTEMRIVPLINSMVKISTELTAASLTRGLSAKTARTSIIQLKLTNEDKIFAILILVLAIIYYGI